jgi:hypothetical protein
MALYILYTLDQVLNRMCCEDTLFPDVERVHSGCQCNRWMQVRCGQV